MLDDVDLRLLGLLRSDARASVSQLATTLSLSRATVRNRIERMREEGHILGFTVVTPDPQTDSAIRAVTMIEVGARAQESVVQRLIGMSEVRHLHSTNGQWDLVAEITTETLNDFDSCLNRIRLIDGIVATQTSLLLKTRKSSRVAS